MEDKSQFRLVLEMVLILVTAIMGLVSMALIAWYSYQNDYQMAMYWMLWYIILRLMGGRFEKE